MEIINWFTNLLFVSDRDLISFFFKSFSVVFSFLFVVYSVVLVRQTEVLNSTLETKNKGAISFGSNVQLLLSVFILLLALFFI
jgi:hypothetical protein